MAQADSQKDKKEVTTKNNQLDQSYWGIVKRQFNKNRLAVWSLRSVYLIIFVGVFADFIANEKPLYCKYNGNTYFPVLRQYLVDLNLAQWPKDLINADWQNLKYESVIYPPIPYSPEKTDFRNSDYKGPFDEQDVAGKRWRHHLGTDQIGRDVMSGIVHGTRIAMLVGVVSMTIASILGIVMGALAGYYGDERFKVSRIRLILNLFVLPLAMFYAFATRSYIMKDAFAESFGSFGVQFFISLLIFTAIMAAPNLLTIVLKRIPMMGNKITIPLDIIISRAIEIIISIPTLLLILSICAIATKPSIMLIMVIIGFTGWTGIARYIRAELLRVRSLEFIEAAQSLGFSEMRIMFRHAIPNSLTSVLITIAFGVANAILAESSLSYLGIGTQADTVTWGKLLSLSREYSPAWWLAIFPGFTIFFTVTIFNLLGDGLTDAMDPRQKH